MRRIFLSAMVCLLGGPLLVAGPDEKELTDNELIREIIRTTRPLAEPRGERLPLYLWQAHHLGTADEEEMEWLVKQLDARGIAVLANWRPDEGQALEQALRLGRIQQRLGAPISINATACTYSFFNGDPRTAHIDDRGQPFFDLSFARDRKMGCPFAVDFRLPEMRRRVEDPVRAYKEAGLDIHFVYADWEIDGPIEWNGAWESSKRCARCRRNIPNIESFEAIQAALRAKRSELQKAMLSDPVKAHFPNALVGNYGVHPHDGYRYWYDYFEEFVEGAPHKLDGRARYRKWFHEFESTGYTFAMPVVYPRYRIFGWYDFEPSDYRWFYNMLLVGSNVGRSTPPEISIITFVSWGTTSRPSNSGPGVKQFSEEKYQELLWHLLLRGHDTFFQWSPRARALKESQLVHQVYAASHAYREFLARGQPLAYDVPGRPGPIVSGLKLGSRLLVRRTDFDRRKAPLPLRVNGKTIEIPRLEGRCQVIELDPYSKAIPAPAF
ncbi:MAG: hypothetical protein ACE5JI_10830 [Acidobacteriota bacterium]